MKYRLLTSWVLGILAPLIVLGVYWLGGNEFHRSFDLAFVTSLAVAVGPVAYLLCLTCPFWEINKWG